MPASTLRSASEAVMQAAGRLVARGELAAAEQRLLAHLREWREDTRALNALAALLIETGRRDIAVAVMERLIALEPAVPSHHLGLAALLAELGRDAELVPLYQRMCSCLPDSALAHFNLACALRRAGRDEEALAAHRRAIARGIEQPEEVWSNIAAILADLRRDAESREALERALEINPRWVPALYNLGLWHEEHGEREAALSRFGQVLAMDPGMHAARARIAWLRPCPEPADPLLAEIRSALGTGALTPSEREDLLFALGKSLEDCGHHEEAFEAFEAGNRESRARLQPYRREAAEASFRAIREQLDATWLSGVEAVSAQPLVFICGMFRSGSTLLEQMLAEHPGITAGGELAYFSARLGDASAYPRRAASDAAFRSALGAGYLKLLSTRFPGSARLTDKRPDNFLYIGLLAAMFPNARFLHTRREARDLCVSIWTQQLEETLGYAADLPDTAHYLRLHDGLMAHWRGFLADRILTVDYERLVTEPEPMLRGVCDFLGVDWDPRMLRFHASQKRVRTASLWQIRQPLYGTSVGRWRRFAGQLDALLGQEPGSGEGADGQ